MADDNASESEELFQGMVDLNSKIDRMRATTAIQMRRKRRIIKVDFFTLSLGRELSFGREGRDIIGNCLRNSLITTLPSINTNYFQLFTLIRLNPESLFLHIGAMGEFRSTVNKVETVEKLEEDNEVSKFIVSILLYNRTDGRLFENNAGKTVY